MTSKSSKKNKTARLSQSFKRTEQKNFNYNKKFIEEKPESPCYANGQYGLSASFYSKYSTKSDKKHQKLWKKLIFSKSLTRKPMKKSVTLPQRNR